MKIKKNIRKVYCWLVPVFIILLIGCTPNPIIIERNITINNTIYNITYINNTIYINDTVPCNITEPKPEINISFDRSYTLELIRRLKFLEGQQNQFINHSDCFDELNTTTIKLDKCTDELCYENSSWC